MSTGICGIVTVWGVRPCPYEIRHVCIGRFINLGWDGENFTNIPITSAIVRVIEKSQKFEENNMSRASQS